MREVEAYLAAFDELRRRKRWTTDTLVLRFAALSLASLDAPASAEALERAADALKEKAGWFGSLRSVVRYCVAATLLRTGLDPRRVADQIESLREQFRQRRMRRGGIREVMAALVLIVRAEGKSVAPAVVDRMQDLLDRWKKDHWWLTGVDDYPLAALHASGSEAPESIAARIEQIYQGLRAAGFSRGNGLQLCSHLLAVCPEPVDKTVARARALADALKKRGIRIGRDRYDELALLALAGGPAESLAERMVELVARLRAFRPRPSNDVAVSLAAGVLAGEAARGASRLADVRDLAAILTVQAFLEQRAAAAAAAGAA